MCVKGEQAFPLYTLSACIHNTNCNRPTQLLISTTPSWSSRTWSVPALYYAETRPQNGHVTQFSTARSIAAQLPRTHDGEGDDAQRARGQMGDDQGHGWQGEERPLSHDLPNGLLPCKPCALAAVGAAPSLAGCRPQCVHLAPDHCRAYVSRSASSAALRTKNRWTSVAARVGAPR